MYGNLILFLIVLVMYTTKEPVDQPSYPLLAALGFNVVLYAIYLYVSRSLFRRLAQGVEDGTVTSPGRRYYSLTLRLTIQALIHFVIAVQFAGLKELLHTLPLVDESAFFSAVLGLTAFTAYLSIMWAESHRVFRIIHSTSLPKKRYVISQIRFNLPVVLPYLILSLLLDVFGLFPEGPVKIWMDSPTGQIIGFVAYLSLLIVFLPMIIRPFWNLQPLPPGEHRTLIENFCRKHGFHYREIMLWPLYEGEGLTAGVMGLVARWRFILVTKALLRVLDEEELEAVMAHELGHVKKRHLGLYVAFFVSFILILSLLAGLMVTTLHLFGGSFESFTGISLLSSGDGLSFIQGVFTCIAIIVFIRFILGPYIRNFERQADLFAYRLTGSTRGLISSLEKIAHYSGQNREMPSWHHYSVAQRVAFLEQCEIHPPTADRHDKKVRRMVAGYAIAFVAVVAVGLAGGAGLNTNLGPEQLIPIVKSRIEKEPDDPKLHGALGDLYLMTDRFELALNAYTRAVRLEPENSMWHRRLGDIYATNNRSRDALASYETALSLAPGDPVVLNNLAWALVTSRDPTLEEKERGLELARKANELEKAAYIMDTLSEALFVNGKYEEALIVNIRASRYLKPEDDREYYMKQRSKFEEALERSRSG